MSLFRITLDIEVDDTFNDIEDPVNWDWRWLLNVDYSDFFKDVHFLSSEKIR